MARTSYAATPTWPALQHTEVACTHCTGSYCYSARLHAQQLGHHLTATCTVARCTPAWSKTPGHGLPSQHLLLTVKLIHTLQAMHHCFAHAHTACLYLHPSVCILLAYLHPSNCLYIPVNVLSIKHCFLQLQHLYSIQE